ncbi:Efflux RND transporter periplasmic adaptor subunit [Rhodovastum atsumiense]|nr:efflux RND transporter periplasmic adaptor subunit [Rhodovastum atsumiense]CAH2600727.1 Efflux RND transporter periplasmic adaptor subunit [Rhodovastum atsumiense]
MQDHVSSDRRQLAAVAAAQPQRRALLLAGAGVVLLAGIAVVLAAPHLAARRPAAVAPAAVPAEPPPALTVLLTPATPRLLARTVSGDGSVVAWQELVVGTETGGLRVSEVAVEEGDKVTRGQVLARLDDAVPAAQAAQAEAAVTEAEAVLQLARIDLNRSVELTRSDSVSRQTLDQRQSAARQAEARLASARARRDEAVARLDQTRIRAPADGVISKRGVLPGAVVQPGQELFRLIRDGRLELDARIPELELAGLRPGQKVRVLHGEREIEGQIRALAPVVASDTRLGVVHVALPADSFLRPGMFARAEIRPDAAAVLTVPQEAVVFREGGPVVFVLPEGGERVVQRPLGTGARREGLVEVTQGLAAGDRVVAAGAGFLSDGDRVRVATGH